MVFSSVAFMFLFFPAVVFLYFLVPGIKAKNLVLIIFSLIFYAYGEPKAVGIMLASVLINYLLALGIDCSRKGRAKKALLTMAVIANLGMLFVLKYLNFAVDVFNSITAGNIEIPQIALPIGISFFTFQALSYVIDVYRGEIAVQKSISKMLLYISFFPQLIAGPIVKYRDIQAQLSEREHSLDKAALGLRQFISGLSAKLLLANSMGAVADKVFSYNAESLFPLLCWIGAVAYMLQIYFDFSGYSDMAIGMGRLFGFDFPKNFNLPFMAGGIKDFWRRWHISLSSWFRDYLYIPLGGNRRGEARKLLNLMLVFLFTGLWHGANFTFIIWGIIHGIFVCLENIFHISKVPKPLMHIYTILLVMLTFVVFRSDNVDYAISYLRAMLCAAESANSSLAIELLNPYNITIFILATLIGFGFHFKLEKLIVQRFGGAETLKYVLSLFLFGLCVINLAASTYNPFIYFRF